MAGDEMIAWYDINNRRVGVRPDTNGLVIYLDRPEHAIGAVDVYGEPLLGVYDGHGEVAVYVHNIARDDVTVSLGGSNEWESLPSRHHQLAYRRKTNAEVYTEGDD